MTGNPSMACEDADEVAALQRQESRQRGVTAGRVVGEDQVLDQLPALAEEHVLGAAQPDAGGTEAAGPLGVLGGVGIGPHPEATLGVGVGDESVHGGDQVVGVGGDGALEVLHDR